MAKGEEEISCKLIKYGTIRHGKIRGMPRAALKSAVQLHPADHVSNQTLSPGKQRAKQLLDTKFLERSTATTH